MSKIPKGKHGSTGRSFNAKKGAWTFKMDRGWEKYNSATDVKNFKRKFNYHRHKALNEVARQIVSELIANKTFLPNALLTSQIKGHNTALKDTGKFLKNAIKTRIVNSTSIFVGIPKGTKAYRIGVTLHEGATIPVTPRMRQMFFALWAVSSGRASASVLTGRAAQLYRRKKTGWKPLGQNTKFIKVPGRPFIDAAFGSSKAKQIALQKFGEAVDKTIQELTRGG